MNNKTTALLVLGIITGVASLGSLIGATIQNQEDQHTHEFGEWKVVKAPTCSEDGLQERMCECYEKETEEIAALGHKEIGRAHV